MELIKAEVRAMNLIRNGRYQKKVTTDDTLFAKTSLTKTVTIEGIAFHPYFDTAEEKLVYGAKIVKDQVTRFYYIVFTDTDYFYGESDAFTWVDSDRFHFFE